MEKVIFSQTFARIFVGEAPTTNIGFLQHWLLMTGLNPKAFARDARCDHMEFVNRPRCFKNRRTLEDGCPILSLFCAHWDVLIHEMTITQYDISGIVKIINDLKNRQTIPEYMPAK